MNDRHPSSREVAFGPFNLLSSERLLKKADVPIPLGGRALDILLTLVERSGEIVSHQELIGRVWPGVNVEEANLRVHVSALRKALGDGRDGARYISNVSGRGYCFVAPIEHSPLEKSDPPSGITGVEARSWLPPRLSRMVGRDATVRALSAQLMSRRFVSIVGPGGIGKTTVAVSVAHRLLTGFEGAVFFVDLSVLTNSKFVPATVASALGFAGQTQDPLGSLLAFVGERKVLLVLDNCEHVIDTAAELAECVISEAPQAHVLATSREALRVRGEHVHLLYSLACPPEDDGLTADEMLAYPAVELFMDRAVASGYAQDLNNRDAQVAAGICRKLDGIALAIELVASHVGSLGLRGTAELLNNRFGLLWHGRRTALPRHETLNAMLDWSYGLLSEQEKRVLASLSVFVGDFPLSAARSVVFAEEHEMEIANGIVDLVGKSLISTKDIGGSTYYRMLDMTRLYARTKLDVRGDADSTCRRHAIFYSELLQGQEAIQSRYGEYDLSEFRPHVGNVRSALEWALSDHGDAAIAVGLAAAAAPLFIGLSLLDECRRWCERALAGLDDASRNTRQEMVLQEALALSTMSAGGRLYQFRPALDRALTLAEAHGDQTHQLQLLAGLNATFGRIGDLRGARMAADRGAAIARATSDPTGVILAEWMVGIACCSEGDQAEAQFHCERGLALAADLGGFNGNYFCCDHRVRTLVALSRALWLRGFSDQALATMQSALDRAALQYDPVSMAIALMYAASVCLWTGDLSRAEGLIEQLIAYSGRHALEPFGTAGLALKGELAIARDEVEIGVELLRKALPVIRDQYYAVITIFTRALAKGLQKAGRLEEAIATVDDANVRAVGGGVKIELSEILRIKACVLAAQNDRDAALDCLTDAIEVARKQSALAFELRSTMDLARLLSEAGQREQARRSLALVYDRFTEGFETADLKAARALLDHLQPSS